LNGGGIIGENESVGPVALSGEISVDSLVKVVNQAGHGLGPLVLSASVHREYLIGI